MDGVYMVVEVTTKKTVACVDAPYSTDVKTILACWVARQGMTENAMKNYRMDWCPITQWANLQHMLTPISEMETVHN